jgi:hypothetical protein
MSEDEERQYVRDSIAAVDKATGTRPVGWSGPDFQETPHTPALLAAAGLRYVCDWGNDEQPYRMTPKTGELYALGVHASLDDNSIHLHGRRTIHEVNRLWREWFDGLYADGATTGRVMVLHLHPWIMGQPGRIRHLDDVLGQITAHAGVWQATGREIIDWFTAQSGEPARRSLADAGTPPVCDEYDGQVTGETLGSDEVDGFLEDEKNYTGAARIPEETPEEERRVHLHIVTRETKNPQTNQLRHHQRL